MAWHDTVIWQSESREYRFSSFDEHADTGVKMSAYTPVYGINRMEYADKTDVDNVDAWLNYVYELFNGMMGEYPKGYAARSLSMGDVVDVDGVYYFVDRFGFKRFTPAD